MKDKTYLYISKDYVYKNKYEEILIKFSSILTYLTSNLNPRVAKEFRLAGIQHRPIVHSQLYNILREEIKFVLFFYDTKDEGAFDLMRYCMLHTIPFFVVNNPLDDLEI